MTGLYWKLLFLSAQAARSRKPGDQLLPLPERHVLRPQLPVQGGVQPVHFQHQLDGQLRIQSQCGHVRAVCEKDTAAEVLQLSVRLLRRQTAVRLEFIEEFMAF